MMTDRKNMLWLAVLAALAVSSVWLLTDHEGLDGGEGMERGPAWYFDGASLRATGSDGRPAYVVYAPRIVQVPEDGSALLDSPVVNWLQGDAPTLTLTASAGRVAPGETGMRLFDGVRIVDDSTGSRFEFSTDWLEMDTVTQVARTTGDIFVTSTEGEMSGRGLIADMNRGTIRIESSVRGRYAH